jgi:hypothetical protein
LLPGARWRRSFPGDERQLSQLRRWLACLLPRCPALDDVTAVANELCSNAIRHSLSGRGGQFAVEISWYGPAVRVAVADSGAPTGPRLIDDPAGEHGRGLVVVAGLSVRTGVVGDHRGRLVWADIRWEDSRAQAGAAVPDGYQAAIGDGEAALAHRFAWVPAWFGRATLAWWALTEPAGLVTAPTARDLASRLDRIFRASSWPQARTAPARHRTGQPHDIPQGRRTRASRPRQAPGDRGGPPPSRDRPGRTAGRPHRDAGPAQAATRQLHPLPAGLTRATSHA